MSIIPKASTALLLVLGFWQTAHANPLVDTLANASGPVALSGSMIRAQSFVADSSSLSNIEIELKGGANDMGSVIVTLYGSTGTNAIGTALEMITTIPGSVLSSSAQLLDIYNIPVTNLTSGSEYWIGLSVAGGANASWYYGSSSADTGSNGSVGAFLSKTYMSTVAFAMCVSSDNSCHTSNPAAAADSFNLATQDNLSTKQEDPSTKQDDPSNVPEPASALLIGAGMAGLGAARRRRGKRAA